MKINIVKIVTISLVIVTGLLMYAYRPSISKEQTLISENVILPDSNTLSGTITFYLSKEQEEIAKSCNMGITNNTPIAFEYIAYDVGSMRIGDTKLWFDVENVHFYNQAVCDNIISVGMEQIPEIDIGTAVNNFKQFIATAEATTKGDTIIVKGTDRYGYIKDHIYYEDNFSLEYAKDLKINYFVSIENYNIEYAYSYNNLDIGIYNKDNQPVAKIKASYIDGYKMPYQYPDATMVNIEDAEFKITHQETDDGGLVRI